MVFSATLEAVIEIRKASPGDLPELIRMYNLLEEEMRALHEMWPLADGLDEPVSESLAALVTSPASEVFLGLIEAVPVGFLISHMQDLLPQAESERVGVVKIVFTEMEARDIGVAEALLDAAIDDMTGAGAERFDAPVLPGHRRAKNFFERSGFSARSITMHRRKR